MNPQINLTHLKFFCDAVMSSSISESAKKNFVSQSTVSQAIAKLERILGTDLIHHAKQKFSVTENGKAVFERSHHVFKAVQDLHDHIHSSKEEISGTLNFVSTNSLGISLLAPLYDQLHAHYPFLQLKFSLGGLNFIRDALRHQQAEFAIVIFDSTFDQFNKVVLKTGHFNLYHSREISLHQLEKGILVDCEEGMHVADLKHYFDQTHHSTLKVQTELAGWEVVARFAEMGIGVGFIPDYLIQNGRYPTIQVYPIEIPAFEYQICAIYPKGHQPSRAAKAFFDLLALKSCFL